MEKRIKVMIAEEGTQQGKSYFGILSTHGFEVHLVPKTRRSRSTKRNG